MRKIFISYRRGDSAFPTFFIYEALKERFGDDAIFMDVYNIPPGTDFRRHLEAILRECGVLLAIIGDRWSTATGSQGQRRIDAPNDFVRLEIQTALERHAPVIPVLAEPAVMPTEVELPEPLRPLAYCHALQIRPDSQFYTQIERLAQRLDELLVLKPGATVTNSIGMQLILLPAGDFLMGTSDSDQSGHEQERPQHRVVLKKPFYLGIFPVTQQEWFRATKKRISQRHEPDSRCPLSLVAWQWAIQFCNHISQMEKLPPYYQIEDSDVRILGGDGYRLPTEAEWEFACRAGTGTKWSFGDGVSQIGRYAWYAGNAEGRTHPVGEKQPNPWGLYDMHGNVAEWCWDWYAERYLPAFQPQKDLIREDPIGPALGKDRVVRGGSFMDLPPILRCSNRDWYTMTNRAHQIGFRLARTYS